MLLRDTCSHQDQRWGKKILNKSAILSVEIKQQSQSKLWTSCDLTNGLVIQKSLLTRKMLKQNVRTVCCISDVTNVLHAFYIFIQFQKQSTALLVIGHDSLIISEQIFKCFK